MNHYGQPQVLGRILLSIGVIGTYDAATHALRFVHEFSESRVAAIWEAASLLGMHPVYAQKQKLITVEPLPAVISAPAVLTNPPDYLAEKDSLADLEAYEVKAARRRADQIAGLKAIETGQPHYRRFESWVKDTLSICFMGDLLNAEEQITTGTLSKRFEMIFDIVRNTPPWGEIRDRYGTHRLLVECKNTDEPTDADFSKLARDMKSLDLHVAFMAYRGARREPHGKVLEYQRSHFINSNRKDIIVTLSDAFLLQCLEKRSVEKCRNNLNSLWRDHVQRYLAT